MSQTFIPGYTLELTIDSDTVIGLTATTYELSGGPQTGRKRLFGSQAAKAIKLQEEYTFTAGGEVTVENLPKLDALRDATQPNVAVTVKHGAGGTDAFNAVLRVSTTGDGDTEETWTIDGDLDGRPQYTAPT